ncbi:hypothetical protein [Marinospirillum alkaliphilum]|uniref:Uncharacterized protein n=1 Tax=Marinospirillum alkaliphilum DSM 21637 TaxID=1122209 RepID=A0A1K1Z138_9GAMM|nr:hypothetical protein [Marinospirillum alkaliphilum]SFX67364.1 hypothetical protein SAMN02745752_02499 [Marinospirillum alkaliphilum DSM 21637]
MNRNSVQKIIQLQEYSWRAINLIALKLFIVMAFPVFLMWNAIEIFDGIYKFFGADMVGYGPASQRWYRILACILVFLSFFAYGAGVFGVIKGERNFPSYRTRELKRIFYKVSGCNGIDMDSYCLLNLEKKNQNIKKFSGLSGSQVVDYFLELTEKKQLPEPTVFYKRLKDGDLQKIEKMFFYELDSREGLFRLRGFDLDADPLEGRVRWAIETPWQAVSVEAFTGFSFYKYKVNWGKWELHFE